MKIISIIFIPLLLLIGCSASKVEKNNAANNLIFPYYETPSDLKDNVAYSQTMTKYSAVLSDKKIFIDPGHGGSDRQNKSRNNKIVEADVNLNVSLHLKKFLRRAGADVVLSRETDTTIDLSDRAKLANESKADIFISVHHNSAPEVNNNWTNYTATFYHAREGDYEFEPFEKTLAKYIQRDLSYVMRNPGGLGSFDGTLSDYSIYPGEGYAVLRETVIPGVLVECGFYTSRLEEKRLSVNEFNEIEAWGIFRGIGKMFSKSVPKFSLVKSESGLSMRKLSLKFLIEDKHEIDQNSIKVYFDLNNVDFEFNRDEKILTINLDNVRPGDHDLKIVCANDRGIYASPFNRKIRVN